MIFRDTQEAIATSERRFYEETGQQQNNSTLRETVTR